MQSVTQSTQLFIGHFFDLMCGVTTFDLVAECPTLYCFAQNGCGSARTDIFTCCFKRGKQLAIVVPTTGEHLEFFIAQVRDHLAQSWVWTKEVFANVIAVFNDVALKFAIDGVVHLVEQHTSRIAGD